MTGLMRLLLLSLVFAVGACAGGGPTPYQPAERPGGLGYSDEALSPDSYRVQVSGNSLTSRARVEDYLLLRAAEITLREGYDHFLLRDRQTDSDTIVRYYDSWGPGWGPGWAWRPYWGGYYGGGSRFGTGLGMSFGGGPSGQQTRYSTRADIQMYRGLPPSAIGPAYDARSVLDELRARILPPAE